jgi:hypothetical protein
MPDEYEEVKRVLQSWRSLRWIHLIALLKTLLFMFSFLCLTEWKTFYLHGFNAGLAASVHSFSELLVYGAIMILCVTVIWFSLLKALKFDFQKIGFSIGSFLRQRPNIDRLTNG